ncbi:HTH domain-containing protein|uniref:HTH domain-containing protein n=1 Tax=Leuconostoc lactis TaxID=1246 RepID=A0A6L7AGU0_LEULA|nr:HTH domain-containing protein [Leuconostoc lactis]
MSRNVVAAQIIQDFFQMYEQYQSSMYLPAYRRHLIGLGETVTITQSDQSLTGQLLQVNVAKSIRTLFGVDLQYQWLNNLYFNQQKVGGILTEGIMTLESQTFSGLVVGIGLNLTPPHTTQPQPSAKLALIDETLNAPLVVISNIQTHGVGHLGRSFFSPSQTGLYLSIALPLTFQDTVKPHLLTISTAVVELHISRAAVWKAINKLTEAGFMIESQRGLGYRYIPNEKMTSTEIQHLLGVPMAIRVFDSLDSTNRSCGLEMTGNAYLTQTACPRCQHAFNPQCHLHQQIYFC